MMSVNAALRIKALCSFPGSRLNFAAQNARHTSKPRAMSKMMLICRAFHALQGFWFRARMPHVQKGSISAEEPGATFRPEREMRCFLRPETHEKRCFLMIL